MRNTKPLVHFPSPRTAPKEVISHLRDIDPTFELVWVIDAWVLGRVRPNRLRTVEGARIVRHQLGQPEPDPSYIAYGRLVTQGFAQTEAYSHREADSRIVEDARIRIYNLLNAAEATFAARLDESLGGPRHRANMASVALGAGNVAGDAYRRAFQKPVYSRPYARSVHA